METGCKSDENYVVQCFGTSIGAGHLDPGPILARDYDVFVVQDLKNVARGNLGEIFPSLGGQFARCTNASFQANLGFTNSIEGAVVYFDRRQSFIPKVRKESYHTVLVRSIERSG